MPSRWFCKLFSVLMVALAASLAGTPSIAQIPGFGGGSGEEQAAEQPADPFDRDTPRGTVQGYLNAMAQQDMELAAWYLQMPAGMRDAANVAAQLRMVLDRSGRLRPVAEIDNTEAGASSDGLEGDLDQAGSIGVGEDAVPILLRRVEQDGQPVWLFSATTLQALPELVDQSVETLIERYTPAQLQDYELFGVPARDWIAVPILVALAFLGAWFCVWVIIAALLGTWLRHSPASSRQEVLRLRTPVAILFSSGLFHFLSLTLGISVIARQWIFQLYDIATIAALVWVVFILTGAVASRILQTMTRREKTSVISGTKLITRLINAIAIFIGLVQILDMLGFDVRTGLAALGIGGLALALGAQKTIENLVGSVMLVIDQPIRVGDLCQVGNVFGTVEDIGIRSTRIRTLERTIVTIPNGAFSSMQIENFTLKERFLFHHQFGIRYETTPQEIETIRQKLKAYLRGHRLIEDDDPAVRFLKFGNDSLVMEIFVYIETRSIPEFFDTQSQMLMEIMSTVKGEGVEFAFPSQTVYLSRDERRRRSPPGSLQDDAGKSGSL